MAQLHPGIDSFEFAPSHPVALELATSHPAFVEKARQWAWMKHDPGLAAPPAGWPPGIRGAYGVYNYWYELILRSRMHQPYSVPEVNSLETAVQLALDLSEADPLIQGIASGPAWITVVISGKPHFIRADRVVSWSKFAGSTYDVTLDDDRRGRVDDAAFEMKVT